MKITYLMCLLIKSTRECNGVEIWHRWRCNQPLLLPTGGAAVPLPPTFQRPCAWIIAINANETKRHDQSLFHLKERVISREEIIILGVIITYLQCKYTSFPTCSLSYLHLDVSNQPPVTRENQLTVSTRRLHFDIATEPIVFHPELLFLQSDHKDGAQR